MSSVAREVDTQFNSPESEQTKIIKLNEEDPEFVNAMEQLLLAPEASATGYTGMSPTSVQPQSMRETMRKQDASSNLGHVFMGADVQTYSGHRRRRHSPRSDPHPLPDSDLVVDLLDTTNSYTDHSVLSRADSSPHSRSRSTFLPLPHSRSPNRSHSHSPPPNRSHSHPHPGSGALVRDHPHSRSEPANLSSYDVTTFNRNFDQHSIPNSGNFGVFEADYTMLDSS